MELLIVDDSELVRVRLVELLEDIPGVAGIRQAGSLEAGLASVRREPPELLVLDIHLPDGNAIHAIGAMKRAAPAMRIAMFSNDATAFIRRRCIEMGADWFFDKSAEFEKVADLVREEAAVGMRNVF